MVYSVLDSLTKIKYREFDCDQPDPWLEECVQECRGSILQYAMTASQKHLVCMVPYYSLQHPAIPNETFPPRCYHRGIIRSQTIHGPGKAKGLDT